MKLEQIILSKLDKLKKPIKWTGDHYITTTCLNPKHDDHKPSFWINTETGEGACFSCKFKVDKTFWLDGKLNDEMIEELSRAALYASLDRKMHKEEEEEHTLFMPPMDEEVQEGWRGLTKETISKLGLYVCRTGAYMDRVIFPMKDYEDNILGFNTRALLSNMQPKYKYSKHIPIKELIYPKVYNTDHIVLTEGIMDAISMQQDGIPAIMNFGVNNSFSSEKIKQLYKQGVETIYIALDNDEAGIEGTKMYMESSLKDFFELKLGFECHQLIDFYKSKEKDYNDFLLKKQQ